MDYKYQSIILGKCDVAEADRFYALYTREVGKVSVLGKGVRNSRAKLAGSLETITYAEIFVAKTKGRGKIIGAIVLDNFSKVKEEPIVVLSIFEVINIFGRLVTQEEKDEAVFDLLLSYLRAMEELVGARAAEKKIHIVSLGFIFKLLDALGYKIEMEKCVICARRLSPGRNYINVEKGGTICLDCRNRDKKGIGISDQSIKLGRIFLRNKIENFKKIEAEEKDINHLKKITQGIVGWII